MIKKFSVSALILTTLTLAFFVYRTTHTLAQETPSLPVLADLTDVWNQIDPGGDTICSRGTPYSFFVHPGTSDNLVIYFDGGGGCWNDETCASGSNPIYTETVEVTTDTLTNGYGGIFDLDNPENPFADDSMLFLPYCTADMHIGDNLVTYGAGDQAVEIHHNGITNDQVALNWSFANFPAPKRVFVTGASAGTVGAIYHTMAIADAYPDASIIELSDSGGGWRGPEGQLTEIFTNWGTIPHLPQSGIFEGITADTLSFEKLYIGTAELYPDVMVTQYNTAHDQVQNYFLGLMAPAVFYDNTLKANMSDISAAVTNFRYYTAGGNEHGIIGGEKFYTYAVNGLRFRDWVNDLVNGTPIEVENVQCTTCYKAETVTGN
ncbi:MAG TPA: pectin acetylesterase-family hydrolase [Phototrophicaceae bacterium]|jgi:hypothetical protein|nr:pectin acetylesterase-family hydrolase [Phototrophicaceae bacterium]